GAGTRAKSCLVVARAGELPVAVPSPQPGYAADASPPEHAPGGCRVQLDDAPGDPGAPAARATLVGPKERAALDAWTPAREGNGASFAAETSFSPDGKWLAIVHSAVGIGEEGRLVDVIDAQVRAAPACK